MYDDTVASHALIFVRFFVELGFFCEWKTREVFQIYNYRLSGDLKHMDLNQENKIYWLRYQFEQKLFNTIYS